MVSNTRQIKYNAEQKPVMSAGGGAYTNTYAAITVLKPTPEGYALKPASFIKIAGHRASSLEQAEIPIEVGDVIITLIGKLPITDLNPDAIIKAYRIDQIDNCTITETEIPITHKEIPLNVIVGAGTYHNRNGAYFCSSVVVEPLVQED